MRINGKTDIGCNRTENQDTFRSGDRPGVGAWGIVCDGMGGAQNGKLASAVAADCMEELLYQRVVDNEPDDTPEQMMRDAISLANAEVFTRSGSGESMMGTTVVCAFIRNRVLHIAHVGDSRAYLYQNGKLHQLTRDHSMVQEMVDMGSITEEEADHHPEKNVITRALGVEEDVAPSYSEEPIDAGSIVLMCSDGLSNMVSAERMAELMEEEKFGNLADALVDEALEAGGDDNITVLLMQPQKGDWSD